MICTRSEREVRRKPGTGEGKERSVPGLSAKSDGNRVQKGKSSHLYPCGARDSIEEGYREGKYEKTHIDHYL